MSYNYYLELGAVLVLLMVVYDYREKMRIIRLDSKLFKLVMYVTLMECICNFVSSVLINYYQVVPRILNIAIATLFFILQASKTYTLVIFIFAYINAHFTRKNKFFYLITAVFVFNLVLSVTSPITGFYFYFDAAGLYHQGCISDLGYFFYPINIAICLLYVYGYRKYLLKRELRAAVLTAIIIGCGVTCQFIFRDLLTIDMSVALSVLYIYMTIENPNDYQDRLTHGGNEYGFKVLMERKCKQSKVFSVAFLNIRGFRYVNSIYGMEQGDNVLRKVELYIEEVFKGEVVFRVHNDLFAAVISKPQATIQRDVDRLIKRFELPWHMPNHQEIMLEPMMVVCEYPQYFSSHSELLKLESGMMKKLMEAHETSVLYSDYELTKRYRRQENIERILRYALRQEKLEVYYQPVIDSVSKQVVALEALSRLKDETLGMVPPNEFIPVAETTGLIIPLGFYVLEHVCEFIQKNLLSDNENTIQCVHVNLSSLQCAYPSLCSCFMDIIRKHQVPISMIHMELTESTMLESPKNVRDIMEELNKEGMKFSLDDYGTGYSNISYLIQFPLEKIKFDKNLVWSYFEKENARIIMQNEFETLHTLSKEIIVEGIESKEQYLEMKEQGIHLYQGYYFAKPMSEPDCMEYLHNKDAIEAKL